MSTSSIATHPVPRSHPGDPCWEIAELFPPQGEWSEEEYFGLSTRRLVEFDDGFIEVLPVPTKSHQAIVMLLCDLLRAFLAGQGAVYFAGYRLKTGRKTYREPDVLWLTPEQLTSSGEQFTQAAELVIEVVSPDDPDRDYIKKRKDYARKGIPEYWIVDPAAGQVLVLRFENGGYVEHGQFRAGQEATSHRLPGFKVPVDSILALRPQQ